MMTELRSEVRAALDECQTERPAVLRRSDLPDMLLATDLPAVADAQTVAAFTAAMEAKGWTVRPAVIWLLLDKPVPQPAGGDVQAEGEAGCCLSLLARHPDAETDAAAIRAIVKAAEQNAMALEKVCARLHADWAERLRLGGALPGLIRPYLEQAVKEVTNT